LKVRERPEGRALAPGIDVGTKEVPSYITICVDEEVVLEEQHEDEENKRNWDDKLKFKWLTTAFFEIAVKSHCD
jgi:hypothetical protein